MKKKLLDKANLEVTQIGLGTNAVGGHNLFTDLDEKQGKDLVKEALNLGITFIDTADVYGFGRSEELVGEVIKAHRSELKLATKGAVEKLDNGTTRINNKPEYLRTAVEKSLKRLQTDYIDLYYLHYPDNETPLVESIGELSRLKEEGKIGSIGISNVNLNQLKEANQYDDIDVIQSPYNMLQRSAENDLLPYSREHNISFVPYGPLAFGILGGKYNSSLNLKDGDWRKEEPLFQPETFLNTLNKVEKLKELADDKGASLSNLALAWLLTQEGIDTVIPGGKRADQVKENVKADSLILLPQDLVKIEKILAE
ncbi:aldo/keto reductase [Priestia sp. Y58]|uniref:aldo/keto reductase n=1 Tax=Priestia TaxID=2800373 RepID=UPI00221FB2C1|nr:MULTISPECIES: aldo/keto reductase [Priestia]MCZ8495650.1 aldo/keto reductase [Priestia megaterium]MDG0032489.1 aldo/keto reductase [Priestia sp. Y58]UYV51549.1 aldo/keto reductase [Priestia megaterium]WDW07534.1 aldo/keto reductase [Priestia aryabhattai]